MSPTRLQAQLQPIELDLSAALQFEHGLGRAELLQFAPRLEGARQQLCQPATEIGGRLVGGPRRLLEQYREGRRLSPLGQILGAAKRLRDSADRVVVVGSPAAVAAAEALLAACCHPFHNELARGERGGRPRIYFAPADADNDRLAGLLDILPANAWSDDVDDRWAVAVIDNCESPELVAAVFDIVWNALQSSCNDVPAGERAVIVGRSDSPLVAMGDRHGCQQVKLSDDPGAPGSAWGTIFHPGILLTASVVGMDIVQLLRGAATMFERFTSAPVGDNPALDLAGLFYLLGQRRQITVRQIDPHSAALQPLADLYQRTINYAEPQPPENVLLQIVPANVRRDPLRVTMPAEVTTAGRTKHQHCTLPDLAVQKTEKNRVQRAAAGQPTAVIRLAGLDEASIGQLIQMLSLTTAMEKELA